MRCLQRKHYLPAVGGNLQAYGHYPARVLADRIFRTRENLKYCKEHGIHLNGPKLGKTFTDPEEAKKHKKLEWLESGEREEINRNFGIGKRRYPLDCIFTKLKETSEVMIHSIGIYMNLRKRLRLLLHFFRLAPYDDSELVGGDWFGPFPKNPFVQ